MTKKITKDMKLGEAIEIFPESTQVLLEHGLHCVGCHANPYETIEEGAKAHGMDDEQIEEMVAEINKSISKHKKECKCEENCTCEGD
ncbi:MAG: DUF1858 domain-containing protein [Candidatus Aenigmatarchaeota archaeon]|nr:DUF1858 domain-containing protein [Nanoarchaeota archaeon]